jgi:hypothetical protein
LHCGRRSAHTQRTMSRATQASWVTRATHEKLCAFTERIRHRWPCIFSSGKYCVRPSSRLLRRGVSCLGERRHRCRNIYPAQLVRFLRSVANGCALLLVSLPVLLLALLAAIRDLTAPTAQLLRAPTAALRARRAFALPHRHVR